VTFNKLYRRLSQLGVPFWCLWFGETISMFGTQIVQFALGVWIFEETGSMLSFVGAILAGTIPALLVTPIAGSVVDKLDRRYVMIIADSIAAVLTVCLLFLLHSDALEVYHLYIFTAVASVVGTFQGPAYQSAMSQIVRKDHLTRAVGAMGVSGTSIGIIVPAVAGSLLVAVGLPGLVLLDLITFVVGTMFVWRAFTMALKNESNRSEGGLLLSLKTSFSHFAESISYFERNPNMLILLCYSLIQVSMTTMAVTMIVPLIMSHLDAQALGTALSFGAIGALLGSLLMTLADSPNRRMMTILLCDVVFALCIVGAGMANTLVEYCVIEFFAGMAGSIASSLGYAIWMSRVPEKQIGSILVLVGTVAMICTTVMVVFGGIMVETVFDPSLISGGVFGTFAGEWLGVGEGHGINLLFILSGVLGIGVALSGLSSKQLRELK
jgi:DHA3 family macrolide efflux protein-like MFS transporter